MVRVLHKTDSKTSNGRLNGGLKVDDIALKLKLGKRTIERELATLQKQGVVRRVDSKKRRPLGNNRAGRLRDNR